MSKSHSICLATEKIMYWRQQDAQVTIDELQRKEPHISRRTYQCESCGCLHITSMSLPRRILHESGISLVCNEFPFLERLVAAGLQVRPSKNPHQYCVFDDNGQVGELTMTFSKRLIPYLIGD